MIAITRARHTIDASGKPLGRLATQIATILMGKHKPTYFPNVDAGDFVEVLHAGGIILTGKKMDQKLYKWPTGYVGGLKTRKVREVFEKNPNEVIQRAVYNMLPRNSFRVSRMKRLSFKK